MEGPPKAAPSTTAVSKGSNHTMIRHYTTDVGCTSGFVFWRYFFYSFRRTNVRWTRALKFT